MKQIMKTALLCVGLFPVLGYAQEPEVDYQLYPDYSPKMYPDYGLLNVRSSTDSDETISLPDHVNNADTPYFPPVFNQAGGSCSAASRIGYMFTHEMNAYRGANGKQLVNRYPSHFVWLMTNGNSGKYALVQQVGVPNAAVYGGTTYSHLFGNQTAFQNNFGWMQGYDKWYSAMFNRMLQPAHFPLSLKTEEGRTALKRWLYNHNGDTSFKSGGVAGVGVGINGKWGQIPNSPTNDAIGVSGMKFVQSWGTKFNHALTIVGYDDRIEFDLDHNGTLGEKDKDEVGAWIIVNSWGTGFANKGFIYCPYAYAGKTFKKDADGLTFGGHWWFPEVFKVNKDYRPLRTLKVKMDYSHRSELCLSAGIATDLNATMPEKTIPLHHFQFAGDGKRGKTQPAPAIPMLGQWADGKLHTEPMEFGYDLTALSSYFNPNQPLKYFLIIETRDWAQGTGKIHQASILDYEFDREGREVPFAISPDGATIENKGHRTVLSTIVSGESYYEPQNFILNAAALSWQAPLTSVHPLTGYRLYADEALLATLPATSHTYPLPDADTTSLTYSLAALYANDITSPQVRVNAPVLEPSTNTCLRLSHGGFTVPTVFDSKYDAATLEFWIRPHSLIDYNQGAGPGWNEGFKFHANAKGNFVVGWDQENRIITPDSTLKIGKWTHLAVTVQHNVMTVYVDGQPAGTITAKDYSGLGGFEEFDFGSNDAENNIDADLDEVRIWNYARTATAIANGRNVQYQGKIMPQGLLAYYKGTTVLLDKHPVLRDFAGTHHARLFHQGATTPTADQLALSTPQGALTIQVQPLSSPVYSGLPVNLTANYSEVVSDLYWDAEAAGIHQLPTPSPTLTFPRTGKYPVVVTACGQSGQTVSDTCLVEVVAAPAPVAEFSSSQHRISAGEHVTFIAHHPLVGYRYEWTMPGAVTEKAYTANAATTYATNGRYEVQLTVTSPDGQQATSKQEITVVEVAPKAQFDIQPAVVVKGEAVTLKDLSKYQPTSWRWVFHSPHKDLIVDRQEGTIVPTTPGVYDVTLQAANAEGSDQTTRTRGLTVCNADSKNGLFFTSNEALVQIASHPLTTAQSAATLDWWMNPGEVTTQSNGIGQAGRLMIQTAENGALEVQLGNRTYHSAAALVKANEWHHYAITFQSGEMIFYRDGHRISALQLTTTTLPVCSTLTIGGPSAPFQGEIDEFRLWCSALDEATLQQYANQPITQVTQAMADHQLALYYDFNQSGGDVIDRTGHHYDGQRLHFGPDGDAWALSQGVFSLNFENEGPQDLTANTLKNYQQPFRTQGNILVNPTQAPRFCALADWTLENATVNGKVTTTVHVDQQKASCFTMTSGWDGFGDLKNHKAYQTVTLPAGAYTFVADYAEKNNAGKCGESYLVAAEGTGLPDTEKVHQALGVTRMQPKTKATLSNQVQFILQEPTEVSLGLVINMSGQLCAAISQFHLYRTDAEFLEVQNPDGYELTIGPDSTATLFLPYAATVPEGMKVYTVTAVASGIAYVSPLPGSVIPAATGVLLQGQPGTYRFSPATTTMEVNSLLTGVLEDTPVSPRQRYYQLEGKQFLLYGGEYLRANQAYLVTPAEDGHPHYQIEQVQTGIDNLENIHEASEIYDLSGRRVTSPAKGIYLSNGKKIYR